MISLVRCTPVLFRSFPASLAWAELFTAIVLLLDTELRVVLQELSKKQEEIDRAMQKVDEIKAQYKKILKSLTQVNAERDYLFDMVRKNPAVHFKAVEWVGLPESGTYRGLIYAASFLQPAHVIRPMACDILADILSLHAPPVAERMSRLGFVSEADRTTPRSNMSRSALDDSTPRSRLAPGSPKSGHRTLTQHATAGRRSSLQQPQQSPRTAKRKSQRHDPREERVSRVCETYSDGLPDSGSHMNTSLVSSAVSSCLLVLFRSRHHH